MRVATTMPTNFISQMKPKAPLDMLFAVSLLFSLPGCSQSSASIKGSINGGSINGTAEDTSGIQAAALVTGDTPTDEVSTNTTATNAAEKNSMVVSSTPVGLGLDNTYWKLTTLGDNTVTTGADKQELYMVLSSDEEKVTGFSGCNRFAGSYALQQAQISFEELLLTRKTCFQNMGLEHQFLAVLAETEYYAVNDVALILYNNDGTVLAQFASRYLQ